MPENALDRLFKETTEGSRPSYSLEEQLEDIENETNGRDDPFLDTMSSASKETLINKIKPQTLDDDEDDEEEEDIIEEPVSEEVVPEEPKKEYKKRGPKPKNKTADGTVVQPAASNVVNNPSVNSFFNTLVLEAINAAVDADITIHGFTKEQMDFIWDYIKEKCKR